MLFIVGIICLIIAGVFIAMGAMSKGEEFGAPIVAVVVPIVFGLLCMGGSVIYTQGVGEVVVLKNWGGSLAGHDEDAGFGFKAPWQDTVTYDIRNNVLSFMGDEEEDQFEGGSANGSAITINDRGGASARIDVQVNYSLEPSAAEELYVNYGTQENFVKSVCAVDIRAIPREVSGNFDTISILTVRGEYTKAIQDALQNKWNNYGLQIENVSVQNVVYPDSIVNKYSDAQAAEIAKATAKNNQEVAKVDAETKIIKANGEAKANKILQASLNDNIIQQNYIDALKEISKNGNLVVVPEGSSPIVQTTK